MKALTKQEKTYVCNKLKEWKRTLTNSNVNKEELLERVSTDPKIINLKEAIKEVTGLADTQIDLDVKPNPLTNQIYVSFFLKVSNVVIPQCVSFCITSIFTQEEISEMFKNKEAYKVIDNALNGSTSDIDLEKYFLEFSLQKGKATERLEKIEDLVAKIKDDVLNMIA